LNRHAGRDERAQPLRGPGESAKNDKTEIGKAPGRYFNALYAGDTDKDREVLHQKEFHFAE
jgi:hypothetical protein